MMNPTTEDPVATPTAIPVLSQVRASVPRPGRAWAWTRLNPAISVGAMASPLR